MCLVTPELNVVEEGQGDENHDKPPFFWEYPIVGQNHVSERSLGTNAARSPTPPHTSRRRPYWVVAIQLAFATLEVVSAARPVWPGA